MVSLWLLADRVQVTLTPPKKPYKLTKSDKPHRHKHKSKSRSKGEAPAELTIPPAVAFLDHSIHVATLPEPLTPHSIASTVSTKDWSMTMGNQTADQGDRLSGSTLGFPRPLRVGRGELILLRVFGRCRRGGQGGPACRRVPRVPADPCPGQDWQAHG